MHDHTKTCNGCIEQYWPTKDVNYKAERLNIHALPKFRTAPMSLAEAKKIIESTFINNPLIP